MQLDARELADFYETPIGQVARRMISRRLRQMWPSAAGLRVLGYGFAVPYLRSYLGDAERVVAVMPAQTGVIVWPSGQGANGKALTALVDDDALRCHDAFFDRVLDVHGLEGAEALRPLLRQIWRVLASEGRLIVIAPNRASLWAQVESSPFAQGRPFSRGELDAILRGALFVPGRWERALFAPPLGGRALVRNGVGWERVGTRLWPGLAGVHLTEAVKSLYAVAPVGPAKQRAPRLKTVGSNVP